LLTGRRFGPLFLTQSLSAFNGNLCKTAMLFLLTFGAAGSPFGRGPMVSIAAAVFVAPFFLFSGIAGQLADSYDKARMTRIIKACEIAVMAVGAVALLLASLPLILATLFLVGTLSAFFGPIKYAIIPQHVRPHEILPATGFVEAGTFVAILLGQVIGGLIPVPAAMAAILGVAVLGFAASTRIPPAPAIAPGPRPRLSVFAETWRIIAAVATNRPLLLAILGISWFWGVGAVFTSQLIVMVEAELNAVPTVATLFLAMFSIGIALGSAFSSRLAKGEISPRLAPAASAAMSIATLYLVGAVHAVAAEGGPRSVARFLADPASWHMMAALLAVATAGGVFVVPLYALLQTLGDPARRSRDVAASNIVGAVFMVGGTAGAAGLQALGLTATDIFTVVAFLGLAVAAYALSLDSAGRVTRLFEQWRRQ